MCFRCVCYIYMYLCMHYQLHDQAYSYLHCHYTMASSICQLCQAFEFADDILPFGDT
jgi:hypothetical protein